MNYRHAFHAGNFADVMKHATLALVIDYLKQKPAPFRVIDTHAGRGVYDLASGEAQRTGEWRGGIGRIVDKPLPPDIAPLLAPYLAALTATGHETDHKAGNETGHETGHAPEIPLASRIASYPGSPLLARRLLRRDDRLVANELHPEDHAALSALFQRDRQVKVLGLDGWTALKSLLPPKERRGVVLVDPPFEEPGELKRLGEGLAEALRRFAGGVYLLWYPIKDPKRTRAFHAAVGGLDAGEMLVAEMLIRKPLDPDLLNGAGLLIVNPPYQLEAKLQRLLPFLADRLAAGPGAEAHARSLGNRPEDRKG